MPLPKETSTPLGIFASGGGVENFFNNKKALFKRAGPHVLFGEECRARVYDPDPWDHLRGSHQNSQLGAIPLYFVSPA